MTKEQDETSGLPNAYRTRALSRSHFGELDTSNLASVTDTANNIVGSLIVGRQREIARRSKELETEHINKNLGALSAVLEQEGKTLGPNEINKAVDTAEVNLLRYGGERARVAAADINKLRRPTMRDPNMTADSAYLAKLIDYPTYLKMKQAGKTERTGFRWKQAIDPKTLKSQTEKIGSKNYLVEEEIDLQGQPTGSTRRKAITEATSRTTLLSLSQGGKGSMKIPVVSATNTTDPFKYTTISGTKEDIQKQIKLQKKSIDDLILRRGNVGGYSLPFIGKVFQKKATEQWKQFANGEITIDDLDAELRPYGAAYLELETKEDELDSGVPTTEETGANDEKDYSTFFDEE